MLSLSIRRGSGAVRGEAAVALGQIAFQSRTQANAETIAALAEAAGREIVRIGAVIDGDDARRRDLAGKLTEQGLLVNSWSTGARGLASLYAQANEIDIKQAKAFQVEWTPRGWMRPDLDLLHFEQQLYLRQPGYGTSYVTGKYLVEELIKDYAHQLGDRFTLRQFFDDFNASGVIPLPLIRRELIRAR